MITKNLKSFLCFVKFWYKVFILGLCIELDTSYNFESAELNLTLNQRYICKLLGKGSFVNAYNRLKYSNLLLELCQSDFYTLENFKNNFCKDQDTISFWSNRKRFTFIKIHKFEFQQAFRKSDKTREQIHFTSFIELQSNWNKFKKLKLLC